jgi:lipopolysaccharide/colanic/teichoic acid biosynthesis glycosyltransferase
MLSTFDRAMPAWKRIMDLTMALALLLVLLLPLAFLALLVRVRMGSPILFRQRRAGFRGEPFTLLKFRTMREAFDDEGRRLPDRERITPLGRGLRRTSLDELPTLVNVVRGEMSLVGPRPLLMEYLPLYKEEQARRHEVKPGITGWAQVNGRNALSWPEKFRHDVWYVDHQSLGLDLRILLLTVAKVVKREGISQEGRVTMERFRGSDD